MARLQSTANLNYVPTPDIIIDRLRARLQIHDRTFALDPCCGTGAALERLVPNGKLYGVELELDRAAEASKVLDGVLTCAMQDARIQHDAFGLLLLNPPYDDSTEGRLEKVFLERCLRYLRPGGLLIFIIKHELYRDCITLLNRHFDVVDHWRFPDGWFTGPNLAFQQTVLIAKRRLDPCVDRHIEDFWKALHMFEGDLPEPMPPPEAFTERVPVPIGSEPRVFVSGMLGESDMAKLLQTSPVPRTMVVPSAIGCGRPLLSLKQGHIALTLASGVINGVYGSGRTLHVAKGTVVRTETRDRHIEEGATRDVVVETVLDSFTIKVRALTADGKIHEMAGGPPPTDEDKK